MVSPKPGVSHDALYHLAAAAEASPSPQPGHYPEAQHYSPYHHQVRQSHLELAQHHHLQPRHYMNPPPSHHSSHSQSQYRYSERAYSPASGLHTEASASRLPLSPSSASNPEVPPPFRPHSSHTTERNDDAIRSTAAPSGAATSAANSEKKISCMECRLSKVKCSGGDLCTRCKRLGKECYYKSHKRGRKSDSSKIQKLERTVDSLSRALEQFSNNKLIHSPSRFASPSKALSPEPQSSQRRESEAISSPATSHKGADAARTVPPSSSSATVMSPPAHSPRGAQSATNREAAAAHVRRRPSEVYRQRSVSSSWQAPHSITSATPTSDDPDEPENLGLPTLSNPLKLLAHASDSARDRDSGLAASDPLASSARTKASSIQVNKDPAEDHDDEGEPPSSQPHTSSNGNTLASAPSKDQVQSVANTKGEHSERNGRATLFGVYPGITTNTVSRFGPGRGKAFFDMGLFTTKLDNLPHFDPIDRGYLTIAEADGLYAVFMQYINPMLTLLDPHLHTFDYVRSSSALLLSCTCWIAAKYRVEASQIAADLEMHIRSNLLPTILMEGFRNAEIPQALIILAAYHPQMNTLSEDRAWAYVGFAIRIASELDMNSRITVRPANRQDDAGLARRLRNRERTWLNLWLFETSMSQHMGRRPTLANDPVVMGCAHWHLDKFALPGDKAMVAVVQLRLLMLRNIELFENFVDVSVTHLPAERTAKQVELFRRICASDLDTWLATWTGPSHHLPSRSHPSETTPTDKDATEATTNSSSSKGKAQLWPNTDLPPSLSRLQRLKLYYWYARLILDTIALKCSHLGLEVLRPVYKDAYACCMAYLGLFVATMVPNGLFWGHNSTVVTPAYCAIFALRIVGLISTSAGAASLQVKSHPQRTEPGREAAEEDLGIDIDAEYTFEMVEKVAKVCEEAGNATPHRRGAAGSYAFFLFTVLAKAKSAWNAKLALKHAEQAGANGWAEKGRKRERNVEEEVTGGKDGKMAKSGKGRDDNEVNRLANGSKRSVQAHKPAQNGTGQGLNAGHGRTSTSATSVVQGDSLALTTATTTATAAATPDTDHQFLRQLMQFQAGPSGVQTAIVPNPSATPSIPHHASTSSLTTTTLSPSTLFASAHNDGFSSNTPANRSNPFATSTGTGTERITATGAGAAVAADMAGAPEGDGAFGFGARGGMGVTANADGAVDIDWDFGMLDGFLGESLFSDMSFISSSATAAEVQHNSVHSALS